MNVILAFNFIHTWDRKYHVYSCILYVHLLLFKVLSYVGGTISPEMEMPKLLWLKQNLSPDCWDKTAIFLELPEFLSYRATGDQTR